MPDFCFRILFRLGHRLESDETETQVHVDSVSRPLTLAGRTGTLKDSKGLVFKAGGYSSDQEARAEGVRLMHAMLLLGGVIAGSPVHFGAGTLRSQWSESIKEKAAIRDEVDGLDVYENGNIGFLAFDAKMEVSSTTVALANLINEGAKKAVELNERQKIAAELINDSRFEVSGDARFLLRIAAVEALSPQLPPPEHVVTLLAGC